MSLEHIEKIKCPKCGKVNDFTLWESINTVVNPEMKQKVRDGSAFVFKCRECGNKETVGFNVLYHQMEDKIMIHCLSDEDSFESGRKMLSDKSDEMVSKLRSDSYLIRLVRSHNELREKLAIFDAGLDDRVIELMKVLYSTRMDTSRLGQIRQMLMYTTEDKKHVFQIIGEKASAATELDMSLYSGVKDIVEKACPELRKDENYLVDNGWAIFMLYPDGIK